MIADTHNQLTDARELALASAVLLDPGCLDSFPEFSANDMRDGLAALVVATALRMHRDGQTVDLYTVVDSLDRGGALVEKCGPDAVQRLMSLATIPLTSDPAGMARDIHREAKRRRLATKLELLRGAVDDPTYSVETIRRQLTDAAAGLQPEPDVLALDIARLVADFPNLRPAVVARIMRRGETINIIAKSKIGKSWFGYYLALCVALGLVWFGRFETVRGKVLYLDNELHPETLSNRLRAVMTALGIKPESVSGWFDVISLRGQSRDINTVGPILRSIPRDKYSLIVIDAFYRLLPDGTSENDNAQMTMVYNSIDNYSEQTGAAFALIHHATKGGQSDKDVTDVGSGAGAISRAADTHLILRPHEEDDAVVLDARLRSWEPLQPIGLRWSFPVWQVDDNLDPSLLKGRRKPAEERRSEADKDECQKIADALKDKPATISRMSTFIGIGKHKLQRLVGMMVQDKRIIETETIVKGNPCVVYSINANGPKQSPPTSPSQDAEYDSFA